MHFFDAIAPALADLLRVVADYLDETQAVFEQPPPDKPEQAPPGYRINARGGFEAVDR